MCFYELVQDFLDYRSWLRELLDKGMELREM